MDPSVLEAIRTTWAAFRSVTNAPVFTCADIGSEERDSFIASLGFRFVSEVPCADGETRRVYVSLPA
jgi:hypothetical protein